MNEENSIRVLPLIDPPQARTELEFWAALELLLGLSQVLSSIPYPTFWQPLLVAGIRCFYTLLQKVVLSTCPTAVALEVQREVPHALLRGCQQPEGEWQRCSPVVIRALPVPPGSSQFRYLPLSSLKGQHLADTCPCASPREESTDVCPLLSPNFQAFVLPLCLLP